jgi:DNA polymerase (family 10)
MEKGVRLSINPDAHSIGGIDDIAFGVASARKGGLTKEACLNTRDVEQFLSLLAKG